MSNFLSAEEVEFFKKIVAKSLLTGEEPVVVDNDRFQGYVITTNGSTRGYCNILKPVNTTMHIAVFGTAVTFTITIVQNTTFHD